MARPKQPITKSEIIRARVYPGQVPGMFRDADGRLLTRSEAILEALKVHPVFSNQLK